LLTTLDLDLAVGLGLFSPAGWSLPVSIAVSMLLALAL